MKRVFGNFALLRRPDAAQFAMGFTEEKICPRRAHRVQLARGAHRARPLRTVDIAALIEQTLRKYSGPGDYRDQHARTLPPSLIDRGPDNPRSHRQRTQQEPGVTRKQMARRVGGWFVVKNVTEANGRIDVHGEAGKGSAFSVLLPAAP